MMTEGIDTMCERINRKVILAVLLGFITGLHAGEPNVLTPKAQPGAFRTLTFPTEQWTGNLFLVPESGVDMNPRYVRPEGDLKYFSSALGEVGVPRDREVRLWVLLDLTPREVARLQRQNPRAYQMLIADRVRDHPDDLSGLSQLDPNGLFWLSVGSPTYRRTGVAPEVFEPIARLTGLKMLDLTSTGITDAGLECIRPLRSLRGLELTQFPISSRALSVLKDLPALEYLSLNTNVTDAGLKQVAQVPSLRWLSIIDGKMWGPGLAELARLPRLERLCIQQSRSQLYDRNIKYLEGLTQLKSLTFWSGGVDTLTDASLASISELESLEELYFIRACPKLTSAGVAHLKKLRNLRKVDFGHTWVGEPGAQYGDDVARLLATVPQLESIERLGYLSAEGMKTLATLPSLRCLHVSLRDRNLGYHGPTGLSHLAGLTSLEKLYIESGDILPDADLASLETLSGLKDLLIINPGVSERGLASIGKLTQLERLHLDTLTRSGLNHLNGLSNLEYLKVSSGWDKGDWTISPGEGTLDLSGLKKMKDLCLTEVMLRDGDLDFVKDLPALERLMVQQTTPLTAAFFRQLRGLPELNHLWVRGLTDCTGADLAHLNGLPKLRGLILHGEITDAALTSLTGPLCLESLTLQTDHPIREETVDVLTARHPVLEYVHIHALTPAQPQPASVPPRGRTDQRTRPNRRRGRR